MSEVVRQSRFSINPVSVKLFLCMEGSFLIFQVHSFQLQLKQFRSSKSQHNWVLCHHNWSNWWTKTWVAINCSFPLRLRNLHVVWGKSLEWCFCASLCAVSLHSVLLDSTYLWFTFQLFFFHLQFQPHSFSFSLLFPVFYLAPCVHLKTLQNVGTKQRVEVSLLWRKMHAARPIWPSASSFLFFALSVFSLSISTLGVFGCHDPDFFLSAVRERKQSLKRGPGQRGVTSTNKINEERKTAINKQTEWKERGWETKWEGQPEIEQGRLGWLHNGHQFGQSPVFPTSLLSHTSNLTSGCPE